MHNLPDGPFSWSAREVEIGFAMSGEDGIKLARSLLIAFQDLLRRKWSGLGKDKHVLRRRHIQFVLPHAFDCSQMMETSLLQCDPQSVSVGGVKMQRTARLFDQRIRLQV